MRIRKGDTRANAVAAATAGLVRATGSDEVAAFGNVAILLSRLLARPWVGTAEVPWILRGARGGMSDQSYTTSPVVPVAEALLEALTQEHGSIVAPQLLRGFFSQADEEDRLSIARVILLAPQASTDTSRVSGL